MPTGPIHNQYALMIQYTDVHIRYKFLLGWLRYGFHAMPNYIHSIIHLHAIKTYLESKPFKNVNPFMININNA